MVSINNTRARRFWRFWASKGCFGKLKCKTWLKAFFLFISYAFQNRLMLLMNANHKLLKQDFEGNCLKKPLKPLISCFKLGENLDSGYIAPNGNSTIDLLFTNKIWSLSTTLEPKFITKHLWVHYTFRSSTKKWTKTQFKSVHPSTNFLTFIYHLSFIFYIFECGHHYLAMFKLFQLIIFACSTNEFFHV